MSVPQLRERLETDIARLTQTRGVYALLSLLVGGAEVVFSMLAVLCVGMSLPAESAVCTMVSASLVAADNAIGIREKAMSTHATLNGLVSVKQKLSLPPSANDLWKEYIGFLAEEEMDYVSSVVALCS